MSKNQRFPEFVPESEDTDDVEILEVVGVEDEDNDAPEIPPVAPDAGSAADPEGDEYVLDFDDPGFGASPAEPRDAADDGRSNDSDHERLLRLRADYDNLRKRIDRERQEFELRANCDLVGRLLPVVDNLERALAANSTAGDEGPLREGLVMIYRELTEKLREAGLEPIEAVGRHFDPTLHDAVATEPSNVTPANTIVEEMQKGYLFQDKVLRPAMVRVSTGNGDSGEDA